MNIPRSWKKQLATVVIVAVIAVYQYYQDDLAGVAPAGRPGGETSRVDEAKPWRSGQWLQLDARVSRLLSDDNEGSRHQRFIVTLDNRRTLLIAHNIDLAERVPVRKGSAITLRGRYEPNDRGGVIHWTHHDPQGGPGGWIEFRGQRYE